MNGIFTENLRPFWNAPVPPGVVMTKRLTGAWTVKRAKLCITRGSEAESCDGVWRSGVIV